jgi:hypothetical protein
MIDRLDLSGPTAPLDLALESVRPRVVRVVGLLLGVATRDAADVQRALRELLATRTTPTS